MEMINKLGIFTLRKLYGKRGQTITDAASWMNLINRVSEASRHDGEHTR